MSSTTDSSAPAHPSTAEKLAKLEEKYRHELLDTDERLEVRERIERVRRDLPGREVVAGDDL